MSVPINTPSQYIGRPSGIAQVGTAGTTGGISVSEAGGDGPIRQTVITLTNVPMAISNTTSGGGVKVYDFPAGYIAILGATGNPVWTTTSAIAGTLNASKTGNWGLGTVVQANATLATTEINVLPGTGVTPIAMVSSATINVAGTATAGALSGTTVPRFDGTSTAVDLYLNLAFATDADLDADATVTVSGTLTVTWLNVGDY